MYLVADCHTQHQSTSIQKGNVKVFSLTCTPNNNLSTHDFQEYYEPT